MAQESGSSLAFTLPLYLGSETDWCAEAFTALALLARHLNASEWQPSTPSRMTLTVEFSSATSKPPAPVSHLQLVQT